ncbi:MAG: carboxypeptidase-like regulatory domain-containing protein [Myxococcota bacterium]|jgi:hypothetical protein|nr:carboxypeptidase-like regulatory domain-containing protein [Myxococcota bacterium]
MRTPIALAPLLIGLFAVGMAACDAENDPAGAILSGTVKNELQQPLADIEVSEGELSIKTDLDGAFVLSDLDPGPVELSLRGAWYEPSTQTVTLQPGDNQVDLELQSFPLEVTAADLATLEQYRASFDWSVDTVSIVYAARPTRAEVEKALYYRNPALFSDPSAEVGVVPSTPPSVGTGGATGLDFTIEDPDSGNEIPMFDVETAVDKLDETPLSVGEIESSLLWEPAIELYLVNWNFDEATRLYLAGQAIRSERWGGSSVLPPQTLEHVYLHGAELWVELSFQSFLTLGEGITDSNGDGYPEVYVRLAAELYTDAAIAELSNNYANVEYDTLGLVDNLATMLDDLYSRTSPVVISTIGIPYDAPGRLSLEYPFAVLEHKTGAVNVLLVEP